MWGQINQNEQGNDCSSHDITLNVEVMKETQFKECFIDELIFKLERKTSCLWERESLLFYVKSKF